MAKFRSWNEELNEFIYFKNGWYFFKEHKVLNKRLEIDGNNYTKDFWQNAEQFTRLKDKKGVEIFVGDNIQFEDSALEQSGNYESAYELMNKATVVRNGICFTLERFLSKDEDTEVYNRLDEIEYLEELKSVFEYSEVIGNIHENKELMRG